MSKQTVALFSLFLASPMALLASPATLCSFRVTDADDRSFSEKDLNGRITILFYETKEGTEKSRRLRDEMNRTYLAQSAEIRAGMLRMGIVNAQGAPFLFRPLWKSSIREMSKKEGVPLYIDWDGSVGQSCSLMKPSGTSVGLFDRQGRLRMVFDGATISSGAVLAEVVRLIKEP